jgi:hypothetical protein
MKTFIIEEKDIILEVDEINSFEENEQANFELEVFIENQSEGQLENLSFQNQDRNKFSIEQYLNVSFDNDVSFNQENKTEDIYGSGGKEQQSTCD